jgi:hypothetical protein
MLFTPDLSYSRAPWTVGMKLRILLLEQQQHTLVEWGEIPADVG